MKNTFLYLSTCSTCVRIIKSLGIEDADFLQNVKEQMISAEQLAFLYANTNSYEQLINKRGRIHAQMKREGTNFTEAVYKALLEKEYSCLKRPILIWNNSVFLGNSKATVAAMKTALDG
jgi:arsenate reductase